MHLYIFFPKSKLIADIFSSFLISVNVYIFVFFKLLVWMLCLLLLCLEWFMSLDPYAGNFIVLCVDWFFNFASISLGLNLFYRLVSQWELANVDYLGLIYIFICLQLAYYYAVYVVSTVIIHFLLYYCCGYCCDDNAISYVGLYITISVFYISVQLSYFSLCYIIYFCMLVRLFPFF